MGESVALTIAIIIFLPRLTIAIPPSLLAIIVVFLIVLGFNINTKTVSDITSVSGACHPSRTGHTINRGNNKGYLSIRLDYGRRWFDGRMFTLNRSTKLPTQKEKGTGSALRTEVIIF